MLSLLAMLGGGIFRLLPEIFAFFKARDDRAHEITMTELQLKIDQARATQQIDLANAQGAIAANSAEMAGMMEALKAQATLTGVAWADALSSSVRPVLTYWWCLVLYTTAKVISIIVAFQASTTLEQFAPILVTQFDQSIIGSIFAFWFVDRALRKMNL
jgi:hypothetical protein